MEVDEEVDVDTTHTREDRDLTEIISPSPLETWCKNINIGSSSIESLQSIWNASESVIGLAIWAARLNENCNLMHRMLHLYISLSPNLLRSLR